MVNNLCFHVRVVIDHSKFTLLTQETKPLTHDSNKDFLEDKECLYQKYCWGNA